MVLSLASALRNEIRFEFVGDLKDESLCRVELELEPIERELKKVHWCNHLLNR